MSMNPFLADMYGTRETIGAGSSAQDQDVEKLAEAQLLDQALAAEGVDVDRLDAGTILKVAYSLFGEDSALVKAAQEGEEKKEPEAAEPAEPAEPDETPAEEAAEEKKEETAEEKVAQADFLGRVMAHSFVQEQDNITKEAAGGAAAFWKATKGGAEMASKVPPSSLAKALGAVKSAPGKAGGALKEKAKEMARSYRIGSAFSGAMGGGKVRKALGGAAETARAHKKTVGALGAAGLAGTGGAGYLALKKKDKEKKSSALDVIAEQRALEILKEAGVYQEPEPTEDEKLAAAVEQRAWEMLQENGYLNE